MDRSLPVNSGDTALIPGLGRFHVPQGNEACVPQLLSPCRRANKLQLQSRSAAEACASRACVHKRSHRKEKPAHHNKE